MNRAKTEVFKNASNNRFKVEKRFATMVRNHGLRRCRYTKLKGAKIHITLANMTCIYNQDGKPLFQPGIVMSLI